MAPLAGQKRKVEYTAPGYPAQERKRQKGRDMRAIPTQTADAALSNTGELKIASFVKAREFEIAALQRSMKKSRKSLNSRAFQQVPRHMRRRTASHNVKKIPRRLRARALREIKEDNTPMGSARKKKQCSKLRLRLETAKKLQKLNAKRKTVRQKKREAKSNAKETDPGRHQEIVRAPRIKKNKLIAPPQATSKFRRRQINKTWLPTHLWHTKRAHLTQPTLPLWRMAIPLKPTEKSHRPTHRAAGSRGCIAWDASYISTVGCQGTESTLEGLLQALHFVGEHMTGSKYKKWKAGTRHSEGWVLGRDKKKPIAPVTVFWQVKPTVNKEGRSSEQGAADGAWSNDVVLETQKNHMKLDRRLILRVHPSAFHELWLELLKVAKMQKPQVLVEDLRFEIGSVTIQGPQSAEALAGVLKPVQDQPRVEKVWPMLPALNNPATLPLNVMMALSITDPRLDHPPKQVSIHRDEKGMRSLDEMIVTWPLDESSHYSSLFDHKSRFRISKSLPSQKAINRRKSKLPPGQIEPSEKDPSIPVILLAHRALCNQPNFQGSWTLLLPWCCVDLVWRSLMYYPLSTGSTPRFGGLEQTRQVAFEQCIPWYPADFPGTNAGKSWERTESENRFDKWLRRPLSKRHAWDTVDLGSDRKGELGRGWTCDWEHLFQDTLPAAKRSDKGNEDTIANNTLQSTQPRLLTQKQRKAAAAKVEKEKETQARRRNSSSPESEGERVEVHNDTDFDQLLSPAAAALMTSCQRSTLPPNPALATVRIKFLTRGTPSPAARVYRLPTPRGCLSVSDPVKDSKEAARSNEQSCELLTEGTTSVALNGFLMNTIAAHSLRQRWLDLDPNPASQQENKNSSTSLPTHIGADRRDRNGDLVAHTVYDPKHTRDLSRIRVFPPRETKPEVLNILGPRPPPKTAEEVLKVLQPQPQPKMIVNSDGDLVAEALWEKHVPCPGPEDLIGYVTSGGYNLLEGKGTAIGAIWIQRVITGWIEASRQATDEPGSNDAAAGETQKSAAQTTQDSTTTATTRNQRTSNKTKVTKEQMQQAKARKLLEQQQDRERHLCIVRNAGESVGRLAIWELC